ncbi:hypothetical protein IFM89_018561 [Coptis chinensis]|uniref:Uncharacterized protein n=1 Tax=Coptis chinensis TaxID=261450 RepID=A0A835IAT3_9MAGN|nr:hypothetical protein IFM89_018561 [Coptis chinensis]
MQNVVVSIKSRWVAITDDEFFSSCNETESDYGDLLTEGENSQLEVALKIDSSESMPENGISVWDMDCAFILNKMQGTVYHCDAFIHISMDPWQFQYSNTISTIRVHGHHGCSRNYKFTNVDTSPLARKGGRRYYGGNPSVTEFLDKTCCNIFVLLYLSFLVPETFCSCLVRWSRQLEPPEENKFLGGTKKKPSCYRILRQDMLQYLRAALSELLSTRSVLFMSGQMVMQIACNFLKQNELDWPAVFLEYPLEVRTPSQAGAITRADDPTPYGKALMMIGRDPLPM